MAPDSRSRTCWEVRWRWSKPWLATEIVDAMGRYAQMGFDQFIVPDFNLGASAETRWEAFERIREDVVAQVSA